MKKCSIENCSELYYAKGYCEKHYTKWRSHQNDGHKCKVDGCQLSGNKAHGFCVNHYYHFRRGNMDINGVFSNLQKIHVQSTKCRIKECTSLPVCDNYCLEHYRSYVLGTVTENIKGSDGKLQELVKIATLKPIVLPTKQIIITPIVITEKSNEDEVIKVKIGDCIVDGCDGKKQYKTGFCCNHQGHFKRGNLTSDGKWIRQQRIKRDKTCSVDGCKLPHSAKGFCSTHYRWWLNGKIINEQEDLGIRKTCKADGCDRVSEQHGFCSKDYLRFKVGYYDENGKVVKDMQRVITGIQYEHCIVTDCQEQVMAKGMCSKHYGMWIRRRNEEWLKQQCFDGKEFTCCDCNCEKFFCQVDFHHAFDKQFKFCEAVCSSTFIGREDVLAELKKGVWLCSRCHMNRHYDPRMTFYETMTDKIRGKSIDFAYRRLIDKYGNNCSVCGDVLLPREIQFHHRDQSTKEYRIVDKIGHQCFTELCKEVDKCDIICRNCHCLLHHAKEIPYNVTYYDALFRANGIEA